MGFLNVLLVDLTEEDRLIDLLTHKLIVERFVRKGVIDPDIPDVVEEVSLPHCDTVSASG